MLPFEGIVENVFQQLIVNLFGLISLNLLDCNANIILN